MLHDAKNNGSIAKNRQFIRRAYIRVVEFQDFPPTHNTVIIITMKIATALLLLPLFSASAYAPIRHSPKNDLIRLEMSNSRRQVLQQSVALIGILTTSTQPALAEPRPTYLTEPTEEFKENERKAMEFRRQQLEIKQKFTKILDKLNNESKTEVELEGDLKELRALVTQTGGLPNGLKKEDIFKQVRAKKSKGFWPTNVEIACVI